MSKQIYLYGGGGHGKVVLDIIRAAYGDAAVAGIFDDDPQKRGTEFYGSRIIGPIDAFDSAIGQMIIAIGSNTIRRDKAERYKGRAERYATLIHPSVVVAASAVIGAGTVVMPGCAITAGARIGRHCIINTSATVEHDCVVGDYSHIAPGTVLTGAVQIGESTLVGSNSTVVPGIKIGNYCLISAGSVVTRHVPDNAIVRGNPARVIKVRK